ncbi:MAG: carboxymuconolactone decarboxylase family protein [Betaproteobacteria bacterium]|nr:carboxymuconolactone decarboxylase family protein [Betaproteobacteria bacterium]
MQAKRWEGTVGRPTVQALAGALQARLRSGPPGCREDGEFTRCIAVGVAASCLSNRPSGRTRGEATMNTTSDPVMTSFTFPTVDSAPVEARPYLEGPQKHLGFVPNLLLGLSNSPATLASYAELVKNFAKVGLTGTEMQTVLVVASMENSCAYCVAAHSTFATNLKIDPAALRAIRAGTAVQDAKLDALVTFTRAMIRSRGHVSEAEVENFVAAGYTREQGLGILIGLAMKTIANFANHFMQTPLDPQFAAQRWEN